MDDSIIIPVIIVLIMLAIAGAFFLLVSGPSLSNNTKTITASIVLVVSALIMLWQRDNGTIAGWAGVFGLVSFMYLFIRLLRYLFQLDD